MADVVRWFLLALALVVLVAIWGEPEKGDDYRTAVCPDCGHRMNAEMIRKVMEGRR